MQVALAISGRSPSVLLGRMESFVKIAQRGVEAKWVRGTPNKGTLTYTYVCAMPADVVEHGWRGVFRFGDELTGKITEVDRFEVASPKVFVFHLSWK